MVIPTPFSSPIRFLLGWPTTWHSVNHHLCNNGIWDHFKYDSWCFPAKKTKQVEPLLWIVYKWGSLLRSENLQAQNRRPGGIGEKGDKKKRMSQQAKEKCTTDWLCLRLLKQIWLASILNFDDEFMSCCVFEIDSTFPMVIVTGPMFSLSITWIKQTQPAASIDFNTFSC